MRGIKNIITPGQRFDMLTIISEGPRKPSGKKMTPLRTFDVLCDCGVERNVGIKYLKGNTPKSCGCTNAVYKGLNHKQVIDLYNEHKNTYKVADILNLKSSGPVLRILRDNNIPLTRRRYHIDENYFETIDNEEKAYWLGFLAADGTIRLRHGGAEKKKRGSSIVLKLANKDEDHLKKFANIFGGESRITYQRDYTKTRKGEVSFSDNCRVSINSNKLVEDIINKGVTPRKSFTVKTPNIDPIWYKDYIRGYFDGNGSISFKLKESKINNDNNVVKLLNVSFACVSVDFKDWLVEHFGQLGILFVYGGKYELACRSLSNIYKFVDYLYNDSTIYLERKREKAMDFKSYYDLTKERLLESGGDRIKFYS